MIWSISRVSQVFTYVFLAQDLCWAVRLNASRYALQKQREVILHAFSECPARSAAWLENRQKTWHCTAHEVCTKSTQGCTTKKSNALAAVDSAREKGTNMILKLAIKSSSVVKAEKSMSGKSCKRATCTLYLVVWSRGAPVSRALRRSLFGGV